MQCVQLLKPWYGMVWCGMVWYGMVWYGMVYANLYSAVVASVSNIVMIVVMQSIVTNATC